MSIATLVLPHYDDVGYDVIVADEDIDIYGVFDGMGTGEDSRFASKTAAEVFKTVMGSGYDNSWRFLEGALITAVRTISPNPMAGTTATVVGIDAAGFLNYAHAGDSRLYVLHDGRIKQITSDEGVGNMLFNYIGAKSKGVCQAGVIYKWDAFLLCSDGITGDWPDQFIDDVDIEKAMLNRPETAIKNILKLSKKQDDKSLIVYKKGLGNG